MTEVTLDKATLTKLRNLQENLEVRDETGRILGYFVPAEDKATYDGVDAQVSDQELDRREAEEAGRPLPDIMRDLKELP
jgi:hypothetical protein